jgi:catechol 2,3-dioxygenase-like lactoylglutathione lyase family enzyme
VVSALGVTGLKERASEGSTGTSTRPSVCTRSASCGPAESGAGRTHDRYAPGLHHVAWGVESHSAVDRMYDVVRSLGARVLDAPADYPQYNNGNGYYAVFFADPDGLKLECVYTPPVGAAA